MNDKSKFEDTASSDILKKMNEYLKENMKKSEEKEKSK